MLCERGYGEQREKNAEDRRQRQMWIRDRFYNGCKCFRSECILAQFSEAFVYSNNMCSLGVSINRSKIF